MPGADTQATDLTAESAGLEAIASGFRRLFDTDREILPHESVIYDALFQWCRENLDRK